MKKYKNQLIILAVVLVFISTYIGAIKTNNYSYTTSSAQVEAIAEEASSCEADMCTGTTAPANVKKITLTMAESAQFSEPDDMRVTNTFTQSGSASSYSVVSSNQNVVYEDDLSVANKAVKILWFGEEGTTRITLSAKDSNGNVIGETYYDVTVEEKFVCNSKDPLDGVFDDGSDFNIGQISYASEPSSNVAKDQLLCISKHRGSSGASGHPMKVSYKLVAKVNSAEASAQWSGLEDNTPKLK